MYQLVEEKCFLMYKKNVKKSNVSKVNTVLKRVGLEGRGENLGVVLLGGEKQRLGIARAVLKNAKIIYADEPTASFDTENRNIVTKLLNECAANGSIVIIATHDERLVSECDKVICLK